MTSFRFARHMACILSTSHWGGKEAGIKGGAGWLGLWLEVCSELGSPACACLVLKMLEWHDHDGKYSGQRERYVTRSGLGNPIPSIFHSLNVMKFLSALNDQGCVPPCHTSSQRDWRCSWFAHRRRQLPTSQSSNISDERAAAITWTTTFVPLNWCHPRKNSIAAKQIYNPWVGCKTHELAQHHAFLRLFILLLSGSSLNARQVCSELLGFHSEPSKLLSPILDRILCATQCNAGLKSISMSFPKISER